MADTSSFTSRIKIGNLGEQKLVDTLLEEGIQVINSGAESFLPKWIHNVLKKQSTDDRFVHLIRHFPDFSTANSLVQMKTAPSADNFPTVTIEQDSYSACITLHNDFRIPVLIVWDAGKLGLVGAWVEDIELSEPKSRQDGSGTPFYLVQKSQLKPIYEFVDKL